MLDAARQKAIELLIEGKHTKSDIARMCGKSRRWLYAILKEEEVQAELRRLEQEIKVEGERRITSNLERCIDNVLYLANHAKSEKTKLEANIFLIERAIGKATSKLDVDIDKNQEDSDKINKDMLNHLLDEENLIPFSKAE